jgi:Fuc2NAc and GlcNAc transferase
MLVLFNLLISALCTILLIILVMPILKSNALDLPNHRSSHLSPVPRGGGSIFIFTSLIAFFINGFFTPTSYNITICILISGLLGIVGLIDDFYVLPASIRFLFQLIYSVVLVCIIPQPLLHNFSPLLFIFIIFVVMSSINFVNFMDGLDGLVASTMLVAITTVAIRLNLAWPIWTLVGGLLGFILLNWSPAKIFMGDSGSTFLGGVYSVLVLQSNSLTECLGIILVAFPLYGDAFICVVRRFLAGHQLFRAHRLHLYQRLHQSGLDHSTVATIYISSTIFTSFAFLAGGLLYVSFASFVVILVGLWLEKYIAKPFYR